MHAPLKMPPKPRLQINNLQVPGLSGIKNKLLFDWIALQGLGFFLEYKIG